MYYQNNQALTINTDQGPIALVLTQESGRIVYRDKINTIIGIKHPGIVIGLDQYGHRWILHHHYKNSRPVIDREDVFADGASINYDPRPVAYDQMTIVIRAMDAFHQGVEYSWLRNNCQHFVNRVSRNDHRSETISNIGKGLTFTSVLMAIYGLLTKRKAFSVFAIFLFLFGLLLTFASKTQA